MGVSFFFKNRCHDGDNESVLAVYDKVKQTIQMKIFTDIMCTGKMRYSEIYPMKKCVFVRLPGRKPEFHYYWNSQELKTELKDEL